MTAQTNVPSRVTDGSRAAQGRDVADDDAEPGRERQERGDERGKARQRETIHARERGVELAGVVDAAGREYGRAGRTAW